jgi:ribose transport system ATP-binding protein
VEDSTIVSIKNLRKSYPGVVALDNVSINFRQGEVHALVGENGAGKSTLVKILSGAVVPDCGEFNINGDCFNKITPRESKKHGIELIYQELNLVPALSVAENIFLGNFQKNGILVDFKSMRKRTIELFKQLDVNIDSNAIVSDLTVSSMQLVEIAKSLVNDSRVLIMDEPTAPLTVKEIEILFDLIKKLKERGVTIIYISHRLSEVFEISDRLTVMRDGKIVSTRETKNTTRKELIKLMVGRELSETFVKRDKELEKVVLEVKNMNNQYLHDISFSVREGEILGLAGLMGAGRTELVRAIFGADSFKQGDVFIDGQQVSIKKSPMNAVKAGMGLVPEDRKDDGVLIELSVRDNITLPILKRISSYFVINRRKEEAILDKYKGRLAIKTPSYSQKVKNLSGGNQQKVVLSKWLASDCKVLLLDEPTKGIDVGAKQEIYQLINDLAEEGLAIVLITSDMEEMLGMSDRIIVLHEGNYMGAIEHDIDFNQEIILDMASGK